jgi:hypothetical protein
VRRFEARGLPWERLGGTGLSPRVDACRVNQRWLRPNAATTVADGTGVIAHGVPAVDVHAGSPGAVDRHRTELRQVDMRGPEHQDR